MNKVKIFIRLIIPPLIMHIIKKIREIYQLSFGRKIKNGYQTLEFIDYYIESNDNRRIQIENGEILEMHEITRGLGLLLLDNSDHVNVLDFGGGGGNHFHAMRKFMPKKIFNWKVVETPELVGRIVEQSNSSEFIFGKSKLNFYSNINDALSKEVSIDFVIAAGSLQYISDPYEKLNDLMQIGAKVLHISRMPFTNIGHLFSFNQISKLSENGPSTQRLSKYNPSVSNVVYIPNLEEFKKIIGNNYSKVTTLHESFNAYPNTNHRISQYSIIAVK